MSDPESNAGGGLPGPRREADLRLRELGDEQAALRRVATLVARGVGPDELFSAVSVEVGRLFGAEAAIARFEPDGSSMVVVGLTPGIPVVSIGTRWELEDFLASTAVYRTGRPARNDHTGHRTAAGSVADSLRQMSFVSTVAAPIVVEGRLWGTMTVSDNRARLPPDTEERVAKFTDLVGTAISNAEGRSALAASEARARELAGEHAALRRVATLVAKGASADESFAVVAHEAADILGIPAVSLCRFEADDTFTLVGIAGETNVTVGSRWPVSEDGLAGTILATGRPARKHDHPAVSGPLGGAERDDRITATVGVPIVVEGVTWGFIVGAARPGYPIPDGTEERLARFTELVAAAIANTQSREHLSLLADEQAALRRVATLVAREASQTEIFTAIAEEVGQLLDTEAILMVRYEEDREARAVASWGEAADIFPVGVCLPLGGENAASRVFRTGRPARVEDYGLATGRIGQAVRGTNIRCVVAVPILVEGRPWGAMLTGTARDRPLPPGTEARLERFTELLATAIANGESRAQVERLAEEQAALRRVATLVARGALPSEVLSVVSEEVGRLFGSEQAAVARYEPDGSGVVFVGVSQGMRGVTIGARWPLENFLALTTVFHTGQSATKERSDYETATGPIADSLREMNFVSRIAAPIVVEGNLWGVMTVNDAHERLAPDAEERVAKFTELVATAIANAEGRSALAASEARARDLAKEQAALRRVATLVAEEARLDEVVSAVSREVEEVLGIEVVTMCRHEPDGFVLISSRGMPGFPAGSRLPLDVPSLPAFIYRAGGPVRIDDFTHAEGLNAAARDAGVRAAVGVPIVVAGSPWGSVCAASTRNEPFPPGTEERLSRFTDLVATSVSNAIMRDELAASRARVIEAFDEARRRIERDLHDGAQQRLVTLAVAARRAEAKIPSGSLELRADVARVAEGLVTAADELRELSHGIHPAELTEGGLSPALKALARRSEIWVELDVAVERRLHHPVEVAVYYTVSEALTNASKHAAASRVSVSLGVEDARLHLSVRDDGVGGADPRRGSGLTGLRDRIEALGGTLAIESPSGGGTEIEVEIPLREPTARLGTPDERPSPATTPALDQ